MTLIFESNHHIDAEIVLLSIPIATKILPIRPYDHSDECAYR